MTSKEILKELNSLENKKNQEGMARFGISRIGTLGVPVPKLREIAQKIKKSENRTSAVAIGNSLRARHKLAKELWDSGVHEARLLAAFIDDPKLVTEKQFDDWAKEIDSWDICDQLCLNLFGKTKFAYKKVFEFSKRQEEFVKRTSFALMAVLAVHDKKALDQKFLEFLPIIKRESADERNFVRKAVNWALRQIGKRNLNLNKEAIKTAEEILKFSEKQKSKSAKWIANDALRELRSFDIQKRFEK